MPIQRQVEVGKGSGQPTEPQHTPTTASHLEPISTVLSSSQPKKTQKHRNTKSKATEISQSSGPTTLIARGCSALLVADETVHEERGDRVERAATTAASLDSKQDSGTINRTQSTVIPNEPIPQGTSSGGSPRCQDTILRDKPAQTRFERLCKQSYEPPLSRDLGITHLKKKVKKLEKKRMSRTLQLERRLFKVKIESSAKKSLGDQEDASNQERNDQDKGISFVQEDAETQGSALITIVGVPVSSASISVSTAESKLMDKRKKHFAKLRAEKIRRKPPIKVQKRNQMCTYLKNMATYKYSQLKSKSFKEIQMLFNNTIKWINSFVPMDSEVVEGSKIQAEGNEDKMYYHIIRDDGSTKYYKIFSAMLDDFDRQDVLDLYRLVKGRFRTTSLEGYDRLRWGDLITLFEPSEEDEIWKAQQDYTLIAGDLQEHSLRNRRVIEYILLVKIKLLIKKLEDSDGERHVYGRTVGIKRLLSAVVATASSYNVTVAKQDLLELGSKDDFRLTQEREVGEEQEEAFRILKEKLCNASVLALPDGPNDFVVYYDASNQGFGCVLMQRGKIVVYALSQLKIHEKNYTTHDLELDALSRKGRLKPRRVRAMSMTIQFGLKAKILEAQKEAAKDFKAPTKWLRGLDTQLEIQDDEVIYFVVRIWIPSVGGIRKLIMDEAHTIRYSMHSGADKMYYDLRDLYWWSGMKRDITEYVSKCLTCSKKLAMDIFTGLPKSSSGYDTIWVIVDRLTKSDHFLPIREDYNSEKLERIYINEIVARHGVPVSIISDSIGRFASHLWQALQKALGTRLDMSTAYHP
uniref:Putative reverse transcriptase domain-containing protein n=1 Tax=Tanacetum cinerariifolium TaxID=118510 RepID=A0A6L2LJI0_TANCI|nr:putative reverse transcriptase domain-containing protein [Tanacetum cinerariifolium]